MPSKIFQTSRGRMVPPATTKNRAGGPAYQHSDEHALIQHAGTGTFNGTFYATADQQYEEVFKLCANLDPRFIAQVAVFSRNKGYMKDMPAYLVSDLAIKAKVAEEAAQSAWKACKAARANGNGDTDKLYKQATEAQKHAEECANLFRSAFAKVIDNGRMAKGCAQIIRSGATGRKSFGTMVQGAFQDWFDRRNDWQLFRDSVGGEISMSDLIKLIRPKPKTDERNALYRYLIGKDVEINGLPEPARQYEQFKTGDTDEVPDVEFRFLTGLERLKDKKEGKRVWTEIARNAPWHRTRMNINSFARHGVFEDQKMVELVADKLRDPNLVHKARVFPYQLLAAYMATCAKDDVPVQITNALQDALEVAVENVPKYEGQLYICVDISGSMTWTPVTGRQDGRKSQDGRSFYGRGKDSSIMCNHAASLIACTLMRKNDNSWLLPYDDKLYKHNLNPRDSIMTNAQVLGNFGGGGTACSVPLRYLNSRKKNGDLVIYISDYESWVDWDSGGRGTAMATEWEAFKVHNPDAKLVCIDLSPNNHCQVQNREDVLNVGGFSDVVFDIIHAFVSGELSSNQVVGLVQQIEV